MIRIQIIQFGRGDFYYSHNPELIGCIGDMEWNDIPRSDFDEYYSGYFNLVYPPEVGVRNHNLRRFYLLRCRFLRIS